jgi:hypothetical protein
MKLRLRSGIFIALLAAAAIALALAYTFWPKRPKVEMPQYAPASAIIYLEIKDVPDLLNGLTSTMAWKQLAPALGLSSQLNYLGDIGSFAAATGLGSEEAVVLARAQIALVVTSIEAKGDEVTPHLAVIVKTHSTRDQATAIADRRIAALAKSKYGADSQRTQSEYAGSQVTTYTKPGTNKQMIFAVVDDLIFFGNDSTSIFSCIDTALHRAASLGENPDLQKTRENLGANSVIFAFVSSSGLARLTQFGAYVFSQGRIVPDEISGGVDKIASDISAGTMGGIGYSASFENGLVVDRYLAALKPDVSAKLLSQVKPGEGELEILKIVPPGVSFTVMNVQQPAKTLDSVMATVSARVNVVTSAALRSLVILVSSEKFGLDPNHPIGSALGSEIAVLTWPGESDPALAIEVSDQAVVAPVLRRYLQGNPKHPTFVQDEQYQGMQFFTSEDRGGAFFGRFVVLASKEQLKRLIDNWKANKSISNDVGIRNRVNSRPASTLMQSYEPNQREAGLLMVETSALLRVGDGSPETLNRPEVQAAIKDIPPLVSFTTLREAGFYTESRSAFGRFSLFSLVSGSPSESTTVETHPDSPPQ